ncbi:MAG TPA: sulfur transferase domain-containing protein [Vicinamibacterales bacterium]|nr:sulfur transferase domain-containing protein [Vicinamibacterales bacterium]
MQISRFAFVRLIVAVTLLAGAGAGVARAQQDKKEHVAGVYNYTQVDASIACGGATKPTVMAALKKHGFVSVINFRLSSERGAYVAEEEAAAKKVGLKYFHLPFNGSAPEPAVATEFLKIVTDRANQPVYIHCATAGRVGAMWMIKRVLVDHWSIAKAEQEAELIGMKGEGLKRFALDYIKAHGGPSGD